MAKPALLPCPFCGNPHPVIRSNGIGDFFVYCDDDEDVGGCGASTSDRRAEVESVAVRRWNQRFTGNIDTHTPIIPADLTHVDDVGGGP